MFQYINVKLQEKIEGDDMSTVTNRDKRLYNSDLAPTSEQDKKWVFF